MQTILVVDDELGSAEVLSLILEEEGFRAFCAVNGEQGLAKALEVIPDVVIVDYMMPLMDGAQFSRALRADPRMRHVRIVLDSGLPEFVVREHFDGYDAFLRKPFKIEALLQLLRTLLA